MYTNISVKIDILGKYFNKIKFILIYILH